VLGRGRAEATRKTGIEHAAGVYSRFQHVLFRWDEAELHRLGDVGERKMGMRFDEAGISVAPRPSTTIASPAASIAPVGTTAAMRLPSTRTEPAKGCAPEQSRMLTF